MATAEKELKDERLYLRLSSRQRHLIDEAADADEKDITAFALDAVLTRAHSILADRRIFALQSEVWDQFQALLDRPVAHPSSKPRLEKLLNEPSILER